MPSILCYARCGTLPHLLLTPLWLGQCHCPTSLFISFVYGLLVSLCVLTTINSASMNIGVCVSFQIRVFSGYTPRSGIVQSYSNSIFRFLRHTWLLYWSKGIDFLISGSQLLNHWIFFMLVKDHKMHIIFSLTKLEIHFHRFTLELHQYSNPPF